MKGERGNGKELLLTTSDGVELPSNHLKLREKLKMFEQWEVQAIGS